MIIKGLYSINEDMTLSFCHFLSANERFFLKKRIKETTLFLRTMPLEVLCQKLGRIFYPLLEIHSSVSV